VVQPLTLDPEIKGLIPAASGTGERENSHFFIKIKELFVTQREKIIK
jgi:hypothetical protein